MLHPFHWSEFNTIMVVVIVMMSLPAKGVVIDNFERGQINPPTGSIIDMSPPPPFNTVVVDIQSGLGDTNVIDGSRTVFLRLNSGTSVSAELSPDSPDEIDDSITFTVAPGSFANMSLSYGEGLGDTPFAVDLTGGGQDRILIDFVTAPTTGTLLLLFNQSDSSQHFAPLTPFNGPGIYTFLYSQITDEFGPELANFNLVSGFHLQIRATADNEPLVFTISDIRTASGTVPEPLTATLSLMGLGVLGMATRRRAA